MAYGINSRIDVDKMQNSFFFSTKLCDIFFEKSDNKYFIDKHCRHYKNNSCSIHGDSSYPSICALFPYMIARRRGKLGLFIEKTCPESKFAIIPENSEKVELLIEQYKKRGLLEVYDLSDFQQSGYKLKFIKYLSMVI